MPGNDEASGEMHHVVKLDEAGRIELALGRRVAEDGLLLGGEDEVSPSSARNRGRTPKRSRARKSLLAPVPGGEGEVAVHPVEAGRAPLGVSLGDHLGVAGRRERSSEGLELGPELDVAVDLPFCITQ